MASQVLLVLALLGDGVPAVQCVESFDVYLVRLRSAVRQLKKVERDDLDCAFLLSTDASAAEVRQIAFQVHLREGRQLAGFTVLSKAIRVGDSWFEGVLPRTWLDCLGPLANLEPHELRSLYSTKLGVATEGEIDAFLSKQFVCPRSEDVGYLPAVASKTSSAGQSHGTPEWRADARVTESATTGIQMETASIRPENPETSDWLPSRESRPTDASAPTHLRSVALGGIGVTAGATLIGGILGGLAARGGSGPASDAVLASRRKYMVGANVAWGTAAVVGLVSVLLWALDGRDTGSASVR